ncbi:MAG: prepilin-type N-terminal cleavage/methylation domain-containing protein [Candidatus Taylorbacteria bacterium]|nr:prepilin-type N-terminal cleavage/methylation domain-containing protein [Candidatus Taylorbacteria bacterium]
MALDRKSRAERGFTLIELMVIVAVLGLLASIIIASIRQSKLRAVDAALKSELGSLRALAEIYYDKDGHYGVPYSGGGEPADCGSAPETTLFNDTAAASGHNGDIRPTLIEVMRLAGSALCASAHPTGGSVAESFAVETPLQSASGFKWCVDNSGYSGVGEIERGISVIDFGVGKARCVPSAELVSS